MGTLDLHIPKVREGSYFPSLLEPRRRSERALLAVVQQAYVEGVSTRKADALVKSLGCEGISKSQVSRICQELDATVESFLGRPLDGGPYPYLWLYALLVGSKTPGQGLPVGHCARDQRSDHRRARPGRSSEAARLLASDLILVPDGDIEGGQALDGISLKLDPLLRVMNTATQRRLAILALGHDGLRHTLDDRGFTLGLSQRSGLLC